MQNKQSSNQQHREYQFLKIQNPSILCEMSGVGRLPAPRWAAHSPSLPPTAHVPIAVDNLDHRGQCKRLQTEIGILLFGGPVRVVCGPRYQLIDACDYILGHTSSLFLRLGGITMNHQYLRFNYKPYPTQGKISTEPCTIHLSDRTASCWPCPEPTGATLGIYARA